jgi:predicted DNA-binding protein (MmcQ/YjbR family)
MTGNAVEHWRDILSAKLGSEECTPFGPDPLVYKVGGKMFALLRLGSPLSINLKADPQEALIMRESFEAVTPGYHMNKKHWNTVDLEAGLDEALILGWIDDSYDLIVGNLTKKAQAALSKK